MTHENPAVGHASAEVETWRPDGNTLMAVLFGYPIGHSLSPGLHSRWFQELSLNAIYLPFPVPDQKSFLATASALMALPHFLGANITVPYKRLALSLQGPSLTSRVVEIGAANTLWRSDDGTWILDNTDVDGVLATLEASHYSQAPFAIVLIGAGGAAAAAVCAAKSLPFCRGLIFAVRSPEKLKQDWPEWFATTSHVQAEITSPDISSDSPCGTNSDMNLRGVQGALIHLKSQCGVRSVVIVNCTPLGAASECNPLANACLTQAHCAGLQGLYFDMVTKPTPAMAWARSLGFDATDGRLMLETQARKSFELWTRRVAPQGLNLS